MKTGLVLEGGAMRGMYTAAVLDVFLKYNITFDAVVGVSAGALFGVNFLSKQPGRVIRYNKRFNSDKRYMGIYPLLKEGNIISTDYAYDKVPKKLDIFDDDTFKKSDTLFYAVLTDIESGEPEYIEIKSVFEQMDYLRASGSMPFFSKCVDINGKKYLDGGISDSIPFEWLLKQDYDKIVVVLTRDGNYRKKPASKLFANVFYNKNPEFKKKICDRYRMYNKSIEKLTKYENDGRIFVIRPSVPLDIGRIEKNPDKLQAIYDIGNLDCEKRIFDLTNYLNKPII